MTNSTICSQETFIPVAASSLCSDRAASQINPVKTIHRNTKWKVSPFGLDKITKARLDQPPEVPPLLPHLSAFDSLSLFLPVLLTLKLSLLSPLSLSLLSKRDRSVDLHLSVITCSWGCCTVTYITSYSRADGSILMHLALEKLTCKTGRA